MSNIDMFSMLVDMHHDNLDNLLGYLLDGIIQNIELEKIADGTSRIIQRAFEEGSENPLYSGILVISNGPNIIEKLNAQGILTDYDDPVILNNNEGVKGYLEGLKKRDGVYVFDASSNKVTRVSKFETPKMPQGYTVYDNIPEDFVYFGASKPNREGDVGSRTRLGIEVALTHAGARADQIKKSAYTRFGLGQVIHSENDGISQRFYFLPPNEANEILGIYETLKRDENNRLVVDKRQMDVVVKLDSLSAKVIYEMAKN